MKKLIMSILTVAMLLMMSSAAWAAEVPYPVEGGNIYFNTTNGSITKADTSITAANIPATINGVAVVNIGPFSFRDCKNLRSVNIPNGLYSISAQAFGYCSSLSSINIPSSVDFMCTDAMTSSFTGCSNLSSINVAADNKKFSSVDGVLFNKDRTALLIYPQAKTGTSYTVPEGVEYIWGGNYNDAGALYSSSLTSINLPASIAKIDYFVFNTCSNLSSINVAAGNQKYSSVDGVVFNKDKTGLVLCPRGKAGTSYTVPEGVTSIGSEALMSCGFTSITIPEGVTSIGDNAFESCRNLSSITIPASVTSVGVAIFYDCENLTDIYYSGTEAQWQAISVLKSAVYDINSEPIEQEFGAFDASDINNATVHYNYKPEAENASQPNESQNEPAQENKEPATENTEPAEPQPADVNVAPSGTGKSVTLNINSQTAIIDGQTVTLDAAPYMVETSGGGYTMVPLRFISEQLGAQVDYDDATRGITITLGEKVIKLTLGQADKAAGLEVAPAEKNDRTYVPLRYVSEQLGAQVDYDDQTQAITIN